MEKINAPVSNTQVDRHGDRMSLSSLELMSMQTDINIISSHNEHDYRNPPIARGIASHLMKEGYQEGTLYATFEFFDLEDVGKPNPNSNTIGKTLALNKYSDGKIHVTYDINHINNNELLDCLKKLQLNVDPESELKFDLKKAFDPLSIICVVISYITLRFIDAFLAKVANPFWDNLGKALHLIRKDSNSVLCLMFQLKYENETKEILINFTNCDSSEVEQTFKNKKDYIYNIVSKYEGTDVARIVFNYSNKELVHAYSVFNDGTPTDIHDSIGYEKLLHPYKKKTRLEKKPKNKRKNKGKRKK